MSDKQRFLYGLVGAASPEVIRWFKLAPAFSGDGLSQFVASVCDNHICLQHIWGNICDSVAGRQPYQVFLFWGDVPDFRFGNACKPTEVARINVGQVLGVGFLVYAFSELILREQESEPAFKLKHYR